MPASFRFFVMWNLCSCFLWPSRAQHFPGGWEQWSRSQKKMWMRHCSVFCQQACWTPVPEILYVDVILRFFVLLYIYITISVFDGRHVSRWLWIVLWYELVCNNHTRLLNLNFRWFQQQADWKMAVCHLVHIANLNSDKLTTVVYCV